ncbi:hypothetical protein DPEC_G00379670 [Dallia pectoralis]|nr:hypothetical protein DPEC_G00379670 [Dallia pectoralis]
MVAIDLMVYSILSVEWTDEFLVWNPEDFDDVTQMSIPSADVWTPDIVINEFVDVGKSPEIPYVYVNNRGRVRNYKPIQVVTACTLEIYTFPFDIQTCNLTFQSWLHTINDIELKLNRTAEEMENKDLFMNQGEWELLHVLAQPGNFSVDNKEFYAEVKFNVSLCGNNLFPFIFSTHERTFGNKVIDLVK